MWPDSKTRFTDAVAIVDASKLYQTCREVEYRLGVLRTTRGGPIEVGWPGCKLFEFIYQGTHHALLCYSRASQLINKRSCKVLFVTPCIYTKGKMASTHYGPVGLKPPFSGTKERRHHHALTAQSTKLTFNCSWGGGLESHLIVDCQSHNTSNRKYGCHALEPDVEMICCS